MARKSPRKPDGRRTKVTKRHLKVIQARAEGKTVKESGEAAAYSPKNAAQSAYQALAGLRGRMTALLDEAGLGEKVGIENYSTGRPANDLRAEGREIQGQAHARRMAPALENARYAVQQFIGWKSERIPLRPPVAGEVFFLDIPFYRKMLHVLPQAK
jgi:hypothetical protein